MLWAGEVFNFLYLFYKGWKYQLCATQGVRHWKYRELGIENMEGIKQASPHSQNLHRRKQGLDAREDRWIHGQVNSYSQPAMMESIPFQGSFLVDHQGASGYFYLYSYGYDFNFLLLLLLLFACDICFSYIWMKEARKNWRSRWL